MDRELYNLVKELAASKWGIKQGNIKRYVTEAVKEKIERENITPSAHENIEIDFSEAALKKSAEEIMAGLKEIQAEERAARTKEIIEKAPKQLEHQYKMRTNVK
jgi:predicted transcriptional regulator